MSPRSIALAIAVLAVMRDASSADAQIGSVHTLSGRVSFPVVVAEAATGRLSPATCRSLSRGSDLTGCDVHAYRAGDQSFLAISVCADPDDLSPGRAPESGCGDSRPWLVLRNRTRETVALFGLSDLDADSESMLMEGRAGAYLYRFGESHPRWISACSRARFVDGGREVTCFDDFGDQLTFDRAELKLRSRLESASSTRTVTAPPALDIRIDRARATALAREHRFLSKSECRRILRATVRLRSCRFDLLPSRAYVRIALCVDPYAARESDRCLGDPSTQYAYLSTQSGEVFSAQGATDSTLDGSRIFWSDERGTYSLDVQTRTSQFVAACWNAAYVERLGSIYCVNNGMELIRVGVRGTNGRPTVVSSIGERTRVRFLLDRNVSGSPALQVELTSTRAVLTQLIHQYGPDDECFGEWATGSTSDWPCFSYEPRAFRAEVLLE